MCFKNKEKDTWDLNPFLKSLSLCFYVKSFFVNKSHNFLTNLFLTKKICYYHNKNKKCKDLKSLFLLEKDCFEPFFFFTSLNTFLNRKRTRFGIFCLRDTNTFLNRKRTRFGIFCLRDTNTFLNRKILVFFFLTPFKQKNPCFFFNTF